MRNEPSPWRGARQFLHRFDPGMRPKRRRSRAQSNCPLRSACQASSPLRGSTTSTPWSPSGTLLPRDCSGRGQGRADYGDASGRARRAPKQGEAEHEPAPRPPPHPFHAAHRRRGGSLVRLRFSVFAWEVSCGPNWTEHEPIAGLRSRSWITSLRARADRSRVRSGIGPILGRSLIPGRAYLRAP
jgi:hypothetical protein